MDEKGPKGSWRHHNACMYLCTYVKRCKTPKVPGRLEALSHWQWPSVIILLPGDKLKTKLPQIHVQLIEYTLKLFAFHRALKLLFTFKFVNT